MHLQGDHGPLGGLVSSDPWKPCPASRLVVIHDKAVTDGAVIGTFDCPNCGNRWSTTI